MIFKHEDISHLLLDQGKEVTIDGKRHYASKAGFAYPSITTVLGYQSAPGLHAWRKRVGEEEANRVGRKAATNGTKIHNIAEDYLNNKYSLDPNEMPNVKQSFGALQKGLERVSKVYAQEVRLYSDFLGVGGRCDAIVEYDGKIAILDFKTSKRVKAREYMQNYFVQTCAYAIMFEERTGIPVNDLVILSIVAGDDNPVITKERRNTWWPTLKKYIQDYRDYYGEPKKL